MIERTQVGIHRIGMALQHRQGITHPGQHAGYLFQNPVIIILISVTGAGWNTVRCFAVVNGTALLHLFVIGIQYRPRCFHHFQCQFDIIRIIVFVLLLIVHSFNIITLIFGGYFRRLRCSAWFFGIRMWLL